jgi:DNA topoisomerase IB
MTLETELEAVFNAFVQEAYKYHDEMHGQLEKMKEATQAWEKETQELLKLNKQQAADIAKAGKRKECTKSRRADERG